MQRSVRKLIIPLAGFGTRFLPTSKNYPKEMAHLVDKPVIQYLVEEAYDSGIREIIFVVNYSKDVITKYFSPFQHPHQKRAYKASPAAAEHLRGLEKLLRGIKFRTIKKTVTLGDGHSILFARERIGKNEPFAVTMGDLLSFGEKPFLGQLVRVYNEVGEPVVSVEQVPLEDTAKLGVIAPEKKAPRLHLVKDVVEKPGPERAPSNLALTGKYILTPAIFSYLHRLARHHTSGEVRLADGLKAYAQEHALYAYECEGNIQDTGNKFDFLKATVQFALAHPEYGKRFSDFLKKIKL